MKTFEEIFKKAKESAGKKGVKELILLSPSEKEMEAALNAKKEGIVKITFISNPAEEGFDKFKITEFDTIAESDSNEKSLKLLKELLSPNSILMIGKTPVYKYLENLIEDKKKIKSLSHLVVFEIKAYHKLFMVSDGLLHTDPDLSAKVDIINNAALTAKFLDIQNPKISVASAVETIAPQMTSAVDGAVLSKMAERGQFKNMTIDGPLSMDTSISKKAAEHKGLKNNPVAGDADIMIVNNLEVGNSLCSALSLFAGAKSAHIIAGFKCPIIPNINYMSVEDKTNSIFFSSLMV